MEAIVNGSILGIICIGAKYIALLVNCLLVKSFNPIRQNDFQADLFTFGILLIIFSTLLYILRFLRTDSNTFTMLTVALIISAIVPTTNFVILPFFYSIKSILKDNSSNENELISDITQAFPDKYKVLIVDRRITNAFAAGILPFSKVILLGRGLIKSLSTNELKAIIGHEMGHLKLNHLRKLYMVNLVWTLTIVLVFQILMVPLFAASSYFVLLLGSYYGIFLGGGLLIVSGFFQKKYEMEADIYATALVGKEGFIKMLKSLNEQHGETMNNWSWNYPTLTERINNVENFRL